MSKEEVQRSARDGAVGVYQRRPEDGVTVSVITDGKEQFIGMTTYNARRVLGGLCMVLGLELKPSSAKRIQMG